MFPRHRKLDLTDRRFGSRVVLGPAEPPKPRPTSRAATFWRVRCDCGAEDVVRGNMLTDGYGKRCKACAAQRTLYLTRSLAEVLLLAAEHAEVSPKLVSVELGWTSSVAHARLRTASHRRTVTRLDHGVYRLAPRGLAVLRDIVEGRREDRWHLREEIRAALDGGRASGRATLRGAT